MLGRHKAVNAIKKGDLEELKKIIERDPKILEEGRVFGWNANYKKMGLLHIAAFWNRQEIAKFLVNEKKLDIDTKHYGMTALHFAGRARDSYGIAKTLLALGADPCLETAQGYLPYNCHYQDQSAKKLLRSAYDDVLVKRVNGEQSVEDQQRVTEEAEQETTDRAKGFWRLSEAPDEVVYERDMSAQKLRITETFNFAAEMRMLIVQDLKTGFLSQPETKLFSEIPKRAEQAKAEFDARYTPPKKITLSR